MPFCYAPWTNIDVSPQGDLTPCCKFQTSYYDQKFKVQTNDLDDYLSSDFLKEVKEDWCPTAEVDGRYIYFNPKFIDDQTIDEVTFVLAHEVLHVVYMHFGRRSHRDPQWWNMATDYCINAVLVQEKIGKMPEKQVEVKDENGKAAQRVGLYDSKYIGWTSEAIYDDLEKRKVKKQMTLDVHIEMGKDAQDGAGKNANKGIPVEVDEESLKKIRESLKDKVLQAASASQLIL